MGPSSASSESCSLVRWLGTEALMLSKTLFSCFSELRGAPPAPPPGG